MARYRVSFSGRKIGSLGAYSERLCIIEVDAPNRAEAEDEARERLIAQGFYNTHEHIHVYAWGEV